MIRQEYDSAEVINIRVVDGYSFISVWEEKNKWAKNSL